MVTNDIYIFTCWNYFKRIIVKQVITETLDEHGMGLVGAYQAAQNNLKSRMIQGLI